MIAAAVNRHEHGSASVSVNFGRSDSFGKRVESLAVGSGVECLARGASER